MNEKQVPASIKRLLVAQLNELSVRESTSIYVAGIAMLTVAWAHLETVPMTNILGWLTYMIVIVLARLKTSQKIHTSAEHHDVLIRFRNWRVMLNVFYGAGWGAMMFLLNTRQLDFMYIFKFATIAAVLGVTTNIMSVLLPTYIGFIVPIILLLITYITAGEPELQGNSEVTFIISVIIYGALLLISSSRTAKLANAAFEQGFERDIALKEAQESHLREFALREQLAVLAQYDELTGMFNRRHMVQEMDRQVKNLIRCNTTFSVLLVDLDHFKRINDTLGHPVGDMVLIGLSAFVSNSLREIDIFGRWGGEEFLCIMPNTNREQAMTCAERLRHGIEKARLVDSHPQLAITASFGLVTCTEKQDTDKLLEQVDIALYAAKSAGRNLVMFS
jgi:diguanylate cyclase (GGDEF)-like protein